MKKWIFLSLLALTITGWHGDALAEDPDCGMCESALADCDAECGFATACRTQCRREYGECLNGLTGGGVCYGEGEVCQAATRQQCYQSCPSCAGLNDEQFVDCLIDRLFCRATCDGCYG